MPGHDETKSSNHAFRPAAARAKPDDRVASGINDSPIMTLPAHLRSSRRQFSWLMVALTMGIRVAMADSASSATINVKDFGAIGDGNVHGVKEWIKSGRYSSMRELRHACPAVQSDDWSVDEAAFEIAKTRLPAGGGTIYFPEGRYVAAHASWTIKKDHVHLLGDGPERSVLLTTAKINDALVLSGYRHIGWSDRASEQYPFRPDSGRRGETSVTLLDSAWHADFKAGDLVFIRNGACRFDQDYGEFNEVAAIDGAGGLTFKHPLARDYTLGCVNWAGTVANDFTMPKEQRMVNVVTSSGPGNFQPVAGEPVTVGDQLFEVASTGKNSLQLRNVGRGNAPSGTKISAETKIAKSRAVIKLTQSTRDFRAEKIQFIGHRKILNLSNSYEMEFVDCRFVRQPADADDARSGLTIDGDGGRWARFTRCTLKASPPWGMQFARSFGGAIFDSCTFEDATVAFTEFSFDCEVTGCVLNFHGPNPEAVIVVGKSGGDFRITHNQIRAENSAFIFDSQFDIQSQRHGGEGRLVIRDNIIESVGKTQVFRINSNVPADLAANSVTAH